MPDHHDLRFTASTITQRLAWNVWPIVVAAMAATLAAAVLLDITTPNDWVVTAALHGLNQLVLTATATQLLVGAAATLIGILLRPPTWSRLRSIAVEQIGWVSLAAGFAAILIAVIFDEREGVAATIIALSFLLAGSIITTWLLGRHAKKIRREAQEQVTTGEIIQIVRDE